MEQGLLVCTRREKNKEGKRVAIRYNSEKLVTKHEKEVARRVALEEEKYRPQVQ